MYALKNSVGICMYIPGTTLKHHIMKCEWNKGGKYRVARCGAIGGSAVEEAVS
jgi:hypothetical protein